MSRPVIEVLETGTGVVEVLVPGFPGADGVDGAGLPPGGATGQFLRKQSNADGDFDWASERALASQAQAEAGTDNTTVMTPLRVAQSIAARVVSINRNVLAGAGLSGGGSLDNDVTLALNPASYAEAVAGADNTKAMTPLRVAEVMADVVRTARQISTGSGLTGGGNLSSNRTLSLDYASQAEAEAGVENTKAMTPLRVKQAIAALQDDVATVVNSGTAITSSPVTGGYTINANISSQSAAENGTVENTLMTPQRVHQAITARMVYASQAEAEAGADNGKLMTPLRVKQAIDSNLPRSWNVVTSTVSTGYTAQAFDACFFGAGVTQIDLPTSPDVGDMVMIGTPIGGTGGPTVRRAGQKIMGLPEDMSINVENVVVTLMFTGADQGWRVV